MTVDPVAAGARPVERSRSMLNVHLGIKGLYATDGLFPVIYRGPPTCSGDVTGCPDGDVCSCSLTRGGLTREPVVQSRPAYIQALGALFPGNALELEKGQKQFWTGGDRRGPEGTGGDHRRDMLMNLNRRAREIDMPVNLPERYSCSVATSDDDRRHALAWYFRLLVKQELDRGTTRAELLARMGVDKGHLSQIEHAKLGIGLSKLIPFAAAFGYEPGALLDKALVWWRKSGRAESAKILMEQARDAEAKAREAADDEAEQEASYGRAPRRLPAKSAR